MKRSHFFIAALLCAGCATPDAGRAAGRDDLEISLSRGSPTLPILEVTITNRSASPICIARDALENPRTYAIAVHLYDATGNAVAYREERGYVVAPLEGVVRVGLGGVVRARIDLLGTFRFPAGDISLAPGMSAHVEFSYRYCGYDWELGATSTRQPI
ncbi:MAG TPA: hypothetical protein VK614_13640 [Allosphingosinicella sp.]|nr:hypothetical protein [Allosphingosinicella sp.]